MKYAKEYRFPWRNGNHFALLVDGKAFFPAMLRAIQQARKYIFLESYLFESGHVADRFVDALCQKAEQEVLVHVLLDDFGALRLNSADRKRMIHAGVQLTYFNPLHYTRLRSNLFRNHRKLLTADGDIAFVGGMGITDPFDPPPGSRHLPWHDTMLRVNGPVVRDWEEVFRRTWNMWNPKPVELPPSYSMSLRQGAPGRVVISAGPNRQEIKRSLVTRARRAQKRIWIATAYFIPSRKLRRALRRAARNGIDVRLLLPGSQTDHPAVRHAGRRFYGRLLRSKVRIYEYQPRFLHAKILLCDDWTSIGSSNIDRWNLRWNLEANQESTDANLIQQVEALFEQDFSQSVEYTSEAWHRRSVWKRFAEWFWGMIDLWSSRISQPPR